MPKSDTIAPLPRRCDCCGIAWNRLFDTFVNGVGWQSYCGGCADPKDDGPPRPYLGRYPIRTPPKLHLVSGGHGR